MGSSGFIIVFAILTVAVAAATEIGSEKSDTLQSSLLKAPSLQLHVKLKGKNMMIHGQSEFDMFANPIVIAENSSIYYNGFSTFSQGATTFTYTLANGMSYMVESGPSSRTVHCLPSILPFELMLPALNNAVAIPSASVGGDPVACPNGSLFQASFSGVDFILCSTGSGFTAYGLDVMVTAKYLPIPINTPLVPDEEIKSCRAVAPPTSMTPAAITLLTGKPLPATSRNLKAASPVAIQADRCECKSTPRPCIFLHGLGNPNEEAELQDSPELTKEKFGDIGDHAPCCSTVKYAVMNTVDAGWMNETLQQKFCDFSLSMSKTSDLASRTISDTIIVTHSMGGLVIATALATGKCKLAESTSWVAISAPMMGSMAGDYIQDLCDDEITSIGADRSNVTAALCSKSYIGVLSKFSPAALVGGTVIPHKSDENDALVEFESCLGGLDPELFGDNYLDRFYAAKLNHADTAFLTHDGLFKDSKKPFKWFECLL